jgi:iron(III) transport system substrate-binding protein
MKVTRRKLTALAGSASVVLAAKAMAQGTSGGATPAPSPQLAQIYEAAKKEGQLTWYSGILDQPICDKVGAAFTQKYPGVRVNALKTTSQVAFQRLLQDIKAGDVQADVMTTTDAGHMSYLSGKNLLVHYVPEDEAGMVKSLQGFDPAGYYHVSWVGLVAILYNTTKVTADEAPKDWPDLTDPKWKSRIAFGSPNFSGMVGVWTVAMQEKYGWSYFEKLNKLNPLIGRSIDDAVTALNSGERIVAAGNPASAQRSAARGNPLGVNYPTSGTLAVLSPSGIIKGSHSPNAGKLFVEFLAGPEYSAILAANFEQPLRPDVAPPRGAKSLAELTLISPPLSAIEKELPSNQIKWRETFNE